MVKIVEFHDMEVPQEILPKLDYDVGEDLLIFMRNDPMFYRKTFFPAVQKSRKGNKVLFAPLAIMVKQGVNEYCKTYGLPHNPEELLGDGDIKLIVKKIIEDDLKNNG